jgi:hypothetical protein
MPWIAILVQHETRISARRVLGPARVTAVAREKRALALAPRPFGGPATQSPQQEARIKKKKSRERGGEEKQD